MAFVKARPGLSISNPDLSEIERWKYFKHLIFLKSKLRAGCRRLYGVGCGCVGNDLFINWISQRQQRIDIKYLNL